MDHGTQVENPIITAMIYEKTISANSRLRSWKSKLVSYCLVNGKCDRARGIICPSGWYCTQPLLTYEFCLPKRIFFFNKLFFFSLSASFMRPSVSFPRSQLKNIDWLHRVFSSFLRRESAVTNSSLGHLFPTLYTFHFVTLPLAGGISFTANLSYTRARREKFDLSEDKRKKKRTKKEKKIKICIIQ